MAGRHRRTRSATRGRHRSPRRRSDLVLPSLAVAAVLSLGGVGASAAFGGGHDVRDLAKPHSLPMIALAPLPAPTATTVTPPPARPTATATATATKAAARLPWFSVTTTKRVAWVQVVGSRDTTLYAGLLRHGRTISFSRQPLRVTIGDAGAVRLVVKHHPRPAGKPGAVLRLTISAAGR